MRLINKERPKHGEREKETQRFDSFLHSLLSIFLVLTVLMSIFTFCEATGRWNFGIKVGYNQGQLRGQETEPGFQVEKFSLSAFSAGILSVYKINNFLSLQSELLYFQKGGEYGVDVSIPIPNVEIKVNDTRSLNYLEVPLLVKLSIPLSSTIQPTFLFGPSVGFNLTGNLKSRIRVKVADFQLSFLEKKDLKKEANNLEWSLVIGGGLDFPLPKGRIIIDQRFFFGLNANHYQVLVPASQFATLGFPMAQDITYELKMNNYVYTISLGYLF